MKMETVMNLKQWSLLLFLGMWSWMDSDVFAFSGYIPPHSLEGQGSCAVAPANLPYSIDIRKAEITAVVLQNNVSSYSSPSSRYANRSSKLNFNTVVKVKEIHENRFLVQRLGEDKHNVGWVDKNELLCVKKPLKSTNGMEMKFYIKTEARRQPGKVGDPPGVSAYQSYRNKDCGKGGCRTLTRFNGYFVFDERNGRYLLGSKYLLDRKTGLLGWVDKKEGFIWDTAYGLRPRENLVFPKGHAHAGQEKTVCAYRRLEDAMTEKNCIPVLGGMRWYKLPTRIPLLGEEDGFYRVIMPLPGIGAKRIDSDSIAISPELLGGMANRIKAISSIGDLSHIDLFFLIDGTQSMERPLRQVKRSVKEIVKLFQKEPDFRETQLRLGFRIYRDKYAGKRELGEGKSLEMGMSRKAYDVWMDNFRKEKRRKDWLVRLASRFKPLGCAMETSDKLQSNWRAFDAALSTVTTTRNELDDFAENMFGGIQKAIEDLDVSCPNHVKLLFVIGDHGYSSRSQRRYGRDPIKIEDLVDELKGNRESSRQQIIIFFLQTEVDERVRHGNSQAYDWAYEGFDAQVRAILSALQEDARYPWKVKDYVRKVQNYRIKKEITGIFAKFKEPSLALEELKLDLYGGASLAAAIERLKGRPEFNNIPGLFWEVVDHHMCDRLGEQCEHWITDATVEGYMPVSEDLQVDVWFMIRDLTNYKDILHELSNPEIEPGRNLRENFINVLKESLEQVIKKPLQAETGEPLEDFLRRIGKLPTRHNSPLFRHSIEDYKDPVKVSKGELLQLQEWIFAVGNFLQIIQRGQRIVAYDDNGQTIPSDQIFKRGYDILRGENFPEKDMSYDKRTSQGRIYWIPQEFLP